MARPREFDESEAIHRAMDVFWSHGYEGASLPVLLEGMKLTRGSLYKAFTDKKTLFLTAMRRYEAEAVAPAAALLTDERIRDGGARIRALFAAVLDAVRSGDRRGCLLCSAAAGPAAYDDDIARDVRGLIRRLHDGFAAALAASDAHRMLDDRARDELAALLISHYTGLRILARSHAPLRDLERSVAGVESVLAHRP